MYDVDISPVTDTSVDTRCQCNHSIALYKACTKYVGKKSTGEPIYQTVYIPVDQECPPHMLVRLKNKK